MEDNLEVSEIVAKLRNGEKFGIFERSAKVYFSDGSKYNYQTLWKAVRIVNNLGEMTPCKTLSEECPETYVGTYSYKYSQHDWGERTSLSGFLKRIAKSFAGR
jgi:hypothetical protein